MRLEQTREVKTGNVTTDCQVEGGMSLYKNAEGILEQVSGQSHTCRGLRLRYGSQEGRGKPTIT